MIASALRPTISFGRPGKCTSPAEIIVVTPPFNVDSIHPIWFCRGVQSPNTGWTWLSIKPGASVVPLASINVVAALASQLFSLPIVEIFPSIATMVSASRIGLVISPDSNKPIFLITSLPLFNALASTDIRCSENLQIFLPPSGSLTEVIEINTTASIHRYFRELAEAAACILGDEAMHWAGWRGGEPHSVGRYRRRGGLAASIRRHAISMVFLTTSTLPI